MAGDGFGGAVERQDAPLTIGRRESAREAVDHVLVERLKVRDLARRAFEARARALQAIGQRAAEKRDREEQEHVEPGRVRHDAERRQRAFVIEKRDAEQPGQPEVLRQDDAEIQQRAERGNHHPAAAELHAAGRRDRQHVQRGEIAGDAAGDGDEPRDDQRVAGELNVDDPSVPLGPFERQRPEDVQRVGDADEEEQRLAGKCPRRGELDENGRAEQQRADADANRDQPEEFATKVALRHGCSLRQLRDQVEDRQIHRDDDAADDAAEERDHDRLEQRQQAGHRRVDFLFVEVGNLGEHRVERAGRLADGDHLRHHRRKDARLPQRRRDRLAALDALPRLQDRLFDNRVAGGPRRDVESVENRDARAQQRRQRPAEPRDGDLAHEQAEDRQLQRDAVDLVLAGDRARSTT